MRLLPALLAVALIALPVTVSASEFRDINSIAHAAPLPPGARKLETFRPVDRALVESALKQIISVWNTPELESKLAEDFHDKQRLVDEVNTYASSNAALRLVAVQNIRTLQQYEQDNALVSRVSVTARTNLEYVHPVLGTQVLKGVNEYILKISQPLAAGN